MEGVTLDTFMNFLVLCESNGYIELKLSLKEVRDQLQSILDNAGSTQCDNSPPPIARSDERPSPPNEHSTSQSTSFDIHFSDIKTPELISTPLSPRELSTGSTTHPDCDPIVEANSSAAVGGENGRCLTNGSTLEEGSSPRLESKLNFDATPSSSSLDIHFSAIETPEIFSSSVASAGEYDGSITDAVDHTDSRETGCDNNETDDKKLERCNKSLEISKVAGTPVSAAVEHIDSSIDSTDCIDLHDSSSGEDDDADDKLEKLFSDMKLQSAKKKRATKHIPSRKSLSVFIVSDSEDVGAISSDDEENLPPIIHFGSPAGPPKPPTATSPYQTPCTPASGIIFWGSPTRENIIKAQTTVSKKHRRPLGISNFYDSPTVLSMSTPKDKPTRPPPSLTTPSANKNLSRFKTAMVDELYSQFNRTVFDNKLPLDMKIIWNKKLRTTAGYCCYLGAIGTRSARIELSTKVVDSYDRIRDTLVHEMCHAATWIIDGIKGGGHGREWRAWAERANEVYSDLKPITRCHSYAIQYKYNYKCTTCDFTTGRHSKSVNLARARCPYCLSTLELLPKLKVDGTPAAERKLNRYAQFVKDHYGEIKSGSPWRNHKEIMDKIKYLYHQKPAL